MDLVISSDSEERTLAIGRTLGAALNPGDVICLEGELGTGKTVLVRGMARGRGYEGPVTSPTFIIINPYPAASLCHVDAYRLSDGEQLVEAGIDDFLDGGWVCAVEWARGVSNVLPSKRLNVSLAFGAGENQRLIKIRESGGWDGRLAAVIREMLKDAG
jgi:tRNA threonylcarbamoyladenosine biosynthesis protein TsaE